MKQRTKAISRTSRTAAILFVFLTMQFFSLSFARSAAAQNAYDPTKEITVQGTIQKIGTNSGDVIGSHILVQTAQGVVDAHLGAGTPASAASLGLSVGEQVTVTGMMQTFGSGNFLIARILTAGGRTTMLRNSHGLPIHTISKPSPGAGVLKGGL